MDQTQPKISRIGTDMASGPLWRSRLARRLVILFVALIALPMAAMFLLMERVSRDEASNTMDVLARIQTSAIKDAGHDFRQLGGAALRRSSSHMADLSLQASRDTAARWRINQAASREAVSRDVSELVRSSAASAMNRSLAANQQILDRAGRRMGALFGRSAQAAQQRAAGRIETVMQDQIQTRLQERAQGLAQSADDYIREHQNYLALAAQMPNLSGANAPAQKAVLDALVRRDPMLTQVSVIDTGGRETALSAAGQPSPAAGSGNRAGADYFQSARRGQPYLGVEPATGSGQAPTLRLAIPIPNGRSGVGGVLAAQLSLNDLWKTLQGASTGRGGGVSIEDQAGHTLLPPPAAPGPLLRQSAQTKRLPWRIVVVQPRDAVTEPIRTLKAEILQSAQQAAAQMNSTLHASSQQASAQLRQDAARLSAATMTQARTRTGQAFQRLTEKDAQQTRVQMDQMQQAIRSQALSAQQENDRRMDLAATASSARLAARVTPLTWHTLTRTARDLSLLALEITLAACALGSLAALVLASQILRPVVRLALGTAAIARGDLDRRVDEVAPGEIGDLARAFNAMAASLQHSRAELNTAEAQLVQSAKLASLGTLSAGVAHELNQPVAIVRGVSQQLQDEPGLSDDVREDLILIEGQTTRMTKIIKHLRTFCRAGGYELSEVDVNQVVRDCFILIDAQLKAHDITVELALCEDAPTVMADANELEQVFINLITNARDALEGRPNARLRIRSWTEEGRLVVEFHDNGTGVPSEAAARIFDPFFTTKEAGKGTGLGLSISHTLLEKYRGTITTHNDEGAVFTVGLPLVEAEKEQEAVPEASQRKAA